MSSHRRYLFSLLTLMVCAHSDPLRSDESFTVATSCAPSDQACLISNFKSYKASSLDAVAKWATLEPVLKQALARNDQELSLDAFNQATTMGLSGRYKSLDISADELIAAGVDQNELYTVDTCRLAAVAIAGVAMNMAYARWSDASVGLQQYVDAAAQCESEFRLAAPADGFARNP